MALVALSLTPASRPARAADAPDSHVHAHSDLVAALTCKKRGYLFMVRLGTQDVLCLESNVGIEKRFVVVDVRDVLKARP